MATETALKDGLRQAHAALRAGQAATAERRLRSLEQQFPGEINCLWLLGATLLDQGRTAESRALLETVLVRAPDFGEARIDLARACRADHQAARAREEIRQVLSLRPQHHRAWLAYGDVLVDLEQYSDAAVAFNRATLTDPNRRAIEQATAALEAGDRRIPEGIFRGILLQDAGHVAALCGLAALSLAADVPNDALRLLRHALKQCQHLPLIWRGLAPALMAAGHLDEADCAARYLLKIEPDSPQSWIARAAISARMLRQEEALHGYREASRLMPREVRIQMSLGHIYKTLGRRQESEAAYKEALQIQPGSGEAYWSLADLKNYSFSDAEIAAMQRTLAEDQHERNSRAQLLFALGKAFEQKKEFATAFQYYADGNSARRLEAPFDIEHFERRTARIRAAFDAAFFARHSGGGYDDSAPIFIVGLPRSGSTLIEQILASHSRVEGTMELPNIINITRSLADGTSDRDGYPEAIHALSAQQWADLGKRYIDETAPLRTGRPRFTDKMPNNFSHVGLIASMLPRAILIDARRHPMDCCFSTFKQYFAEGQTFSYSLEDLGRYYRCYLSLMDHWDEVLPGKVLRIQYEAMVREPEVNIRRLLEHCGLPFEASCLTFNLTQRSVRTASAEQVRQPIYGSAVGYWRNFEAQLEPLKRALGADIDGRRA
jgi:tetratricopeptide (TPR) repeat protein